MNESQDRRAELIAAAAADDLDEAETAELRRLAQTDPTIDTDIAELRAISGTLRRRGLTEPWLEPSMSPDLRERVLAAAGPAGRRTPRNDRFAVPRLRASRASAGLAAAAAIVGAVVGSGVVLGVDSFDVRPEDPPAAITGPPGTLGAYEQVTFSTNTPRVAVEGGMVAHTWGTETILELDGVSDSGPYQVVLVDRSGTELPSGTFLGSELTIECRMNAAVLRPDVTEIEIRRSDGSVLAAAQLPAT